MARFTAARKNFQNTEHAAQLNELHSFRAVMRCLTDLCDLPPQGPMADTMRYRYRSAKEEWAKCLRSLDALA